MPNVDTPEPICETDTASHEFDTEKIVQCPRCDAEGVLRIYRSGNSASVVHGLNHKNVDGIDLTTQDSICFFTGDVAETLIKKGS